MLIRENVPLAPLTTLGVGGPARFFVEALTEAEVIEAVEFARSRRLPLFVLGGGSNLVVADAGFPGLVLKIGITDVSHSPASNGIVTFLAGAGFDWDALVAQTVDAGCAGLECLSGIPGSVGGTPVQNVGAYGQEVSETIQRGARPRSAVAGNQNSLQCRLRLRLSLQHLQHAASADATSFCACHLQCDRGGKPSLRYADLQKYFADRSGENHRWPRCEPRYARFAIARRC